MEHDQLPEHGAVTVSLSRPTPAPAPPPYIPPQWSPAGQHPDNWLQPVPARPRRSLLAQYVLLGIPVALLLVGLLIVQFVIVQGSNSPSPIAAPTHPLPGRQCNIGGHSIPCPYLPRDLRAAYNIAPLLDRGIDGTGETVMLLEQPSSPTETSNIYQDLAAFDRLFHLPPAQLSVDNVFAPGTAPEAADGEEVLDAEIVHSIAPGARIRIVLADNRNFFRALVFSPTNQLGDVISISLLAGESCLPPAQTPAVHRVFERSAEHGVTVVAASGDFGAVSYPCQRSNPTPSVGLNLPASDPLVTAVGGTRLVAAAGQPYQGEDTWNTPPSPTPQDTDIAPDGFGGVRHSAGSGGGFSTRFSRPDFQNGIPSVHGGRGVPDVAAMADPNPGIAVITVRHGRSFLGRWGGTSAGAPLWAGLAALADQMAGHRLGPLNPSLYRIAKSPEYAAAFHDVTSGTNSVIFGSQLIAGQKAAPGWDPVTGWGTPNAAVLVPLLAHPPTSG